MRSRSVTVVILSVSPASFSRIVIVFIIVIVSKTVTTTCSRRVSLTSCLWLVCVRLTAFLLLQQLVKHRALSQIRANLNFVKHIFHLV